MQRLRWFLYRVLMAVILFSGVAILPDRMEAASYMIGRHPVSMPNGAKSLCETYSWACASTEDSSEFGRDELKLVRQINSRINRRVRQIADQSQYRVSERWALPTRRGGDCEDFALLKKFELHKKFEYHLLW